MIGKTIGHYKIVDKLGEGGMGAVYKAEDTTLRRLVALKALTQQMSENPEARERFVREAQAASSLNHSNITTVHELLEDEGEQFIVMEYVEGKTIRDIVESGHVSIRKALDIIIQAAEALEAAHNKGILHRDVKSANIMVSMEGNVKVMDFGLAHLEERSQLTRTGTTMGTLAYSSPEQLTGQLVDRKSEVFSLGVVFYELLTGQLPFKSPSEGELVFEIINNEQDRPSRIRDDIPANVEAVITKMLEKKPELRYQGCGELLSDLKAIRSELETTTVEISTSLSAIRIKKKRLMAIGTAIAVVVIGAVVILFAGSRGPTLDPNRVAVANFENRTGDESLDHLGGYAAQWIFENLQRLTFINVFPQDDAMYVWNNIQADIASGRLSKRPLQAFAEGTGAGILISGSYYLDGSDIRFHTMVTDAISNKPLGPLDPVVGPSDSPRQAVEHLPGQVMGLLALEFDERLPEEAGRMLSPPSIEAYNAFKEGLESYISAGSAEDFSNAITNFYRAIDLDSTYVLPLIYAGISLGNIIANYGGTAQIPERDSLTAVLVGRRDQLSEYERCWCDWLKENAEREPGFRERQYPAMKRAAELAPGSKAVYNYAVAAYRTNRQREAVTALESLNPESGPMKGFYSYFAWKCDAHHLLGEFKKELKSARRAREYFPHRITLWIGFEVRALAAIGRISKLNKVLNECLSITPTSGWTPAGMMRRAANELEAHDHGLEIANELRERAIEWYENEPGRAQPRRGSIAIALYFMERWEEARGLFEELAIESPDNVAYQGYLGTLAARRGDREEALRISDWLASVDLSTIENRTYWRACIASLLGNEREAVDLLQEALDLGLEYMRPHADIDLKPLHDYQPFLDLMRPKD